MSLTGKLDEALIKFIKKYNFISDHIFLFYHKNNIPEIDFSRWILNLEYPILDGAIKKLNQIEEEYLEILEIFKNLDFNDDFLKEQYKKRISEIDAIIKIIKHFNDYDEKLKFDLITKSFWVDLQLCFDISRDEDIILSEFNNFEKEYLHFEDIYNKVKTRLTDEFDAKSIKLYFEEALKYLKIDKNWSVEIRDDITSIVHWEFRNNWWKILIPADKVVSFDRLFVLIIHEIDWHAKQFTCSNKAWIFKPILRFHNSEEILEWLAEYLENLMYILIFRKFQIKDYLDKFSQKLRLLNKTLSLDLFLKEYKFDKIRVFRWFRDIKNFINTKDLIYMQWLYKIIKYKNIYWKSFLNCLYSWVINEDYILKYCKKSTKQIDTINLIEKSSAFHVLSNILK